MAGKGQTPRPRKRRLLPAVSSTPETTAVSRHRENKITKEKTDIHQLNETSPSESIINPAHVEVSGSVTKNLDDYEFAKVGVMITRPCHDTEQAIEDTYQQCSEWVETKILEEIEKI